MHLTPRSAPVASVVASVVAAMVAGGLAGCGATLGLGGPGVDPTPHREVTTAGAEVRLVERDRADLLLYVSNQSFDDERVRLTVVVDGLTVVDGDFEVADQHNWVRFPLRLSPGRHEITARSDSEAVLEQSFRVPGDARRYAVIDYWTETEGPTITWQLTRRELAFA